ncbi:hypothetical protein GH714_040314 [Hevea brasiliensis]|uniref:Peroxisomal membrane protein 11B n=1 Tax=Hevea brasiliensis TaxID=3981 RepID=A0A6A6MTX6_HEVBR|nr:hypothetical protein GH714_040314 [Hevea brasiliensis]
MNDTVDKLVVFLAKRDGIDKLVKTFQYVSKLVHWRVEATHQILHRDSSNGKLPRVLAGKPSELAGEMVYFFFDHFLWLSRIGTLDAKLARRMSFISAFGESFGYIFFIIADFIIIREGIRAERKLLVSSKEDSKGAKDNIRKIRADRVMRFMSIAANTADLIIALADIEPNPFCNHAVTLGISGLVSAWAGWYRNWPS